MWVTFYSMLLITRIEGHTFFSSNPPIYKTQLIYIWYIVSLILLFGIGYILHTYKHRFLWVYRCFLLASSLSFITDYALNDANKFFFGGFWSDLYDITLIAYIFNILYLIYSGKSKAHPQIERVLEESSFSISNYPFHSSESLGINGKDQFERREFAEHLGNILNDRMERNTVGSLTIGLYGPWGSGKSSIFDIIEANYVEKDKIIRFSPWYLGKDYTNIIPEFLKLLIDNLQKRSNNNKNGKKLLNKLKDYLKYLTPVSIRPPGIIINLKEFNNLSKFSEEFNNAQSMRNQIIEMLKESHFPLVVFIDDLDRLDNKEIQMMFKLVRLIADFPNITYVIAMDEEVVARSLSQLYSKEYDIKTGLKYIEKFIHVPLYLPQPDPSLLRDFFIRNIQSICVSNNMNMSGTFLNELISQFDFTPRNIQRLSNITMVHLPMLNGEIYPDDLISLLAIKIDNPTLFIYIYQHQDLFLGLKSDMEDSRLRLVDELKVISPNHIPLLNVMFPRISGKEINLEIMNKSKRICSPVHFSTYFKYAVLDRQISRKQLKSFYEIILEDNDKAIDAYQKLVQRSKLEEVNLQIRLNIDENPTELNFKLFELLLNIFSGDGEVNYSEAHISVRQLVSSLLNVLLANDDTTNEIIKIIQSNSYGLLLAVDAYKTPISNEVKEELREFLTDIDLFKLDIYHENDIQLILSCFMEGRNPEEVRSYISNWGTEHHVWSIIAILMSGSLEEEKLFNDYIDVISRIPIEFIEREVNSFGNITNLNDAKRKSSGGYVNSAKICLSYAHNISYRYVEERLERMLEPNTIKWNSTVFYSIKEFLLYGNQTLVTESQKKWEAFVKENNMEEEWLNTKSSG